MNLLSKGSLISIYAFIFHQGDKGETGERGVAGERGEKGEMGLSGPSVSIKTLK